ncbi:MAG: hypothetical protein ACTHOO_08625 [Alcanivorax sp.]
MNNSRNIAFGAIAALWLSAGCGNVGNAESSGGQAPVLNDPDQTEMIFIPPIDDAISQSGQCDDDLVDKLVNRDVYERLVQADDFNEMAAGLPEDASLSDRINAYKAERTEKIGVFFDCSDENKELHDLAAFITTYPENPGNADKFRELFVEVASTRLDDINALYPPEMLNEAAHEFKDFLLDMNMERIEELGPMFKEDELDARIDALIEDNHDQLSLTVARLEMADYLGVQGKVEGASPQAFANQFKTLIADEMAQYLREVISAKQMAGPTYEI